MWWIAGIIGVVFLLNIAYNIGWHVGEATGYHKGWIRRGDTDAVDYYNF